MRTTALCPSAPKPYSQLHICLSCRHKLAHGTPPASLQARHKSSLKVAQDHGPTTLAETSHISRPVPRLRRSTQKRRTNTSSSSRDNERTRNAQRWSPTAAIRELAKRNPWISSTDPSPIRGLTDFFKKRQRQGDLAESSYKENMELRPGWTTLRPSLRLQSPQNTTNNDTEERQPVDGKIVQEQRLSEQDTANGGTEERQPMGSEVSEANEGETQKSASPVSSASNRRTKARKDRQRRKKQRERGEKEKVDSKEYQSSAKSDDLVLAQESFEDDDEFSISPTDIAFGRAPSDTLHEKATQPRIETASDSAHGAPAEKSKEDDPKSSESASGKSQDKDPKPSTSARKMRARPEKRAIKAAKKEKSSARKMSNDKSSKIRKTSSSTEDPPGTENESETVSPNFIDMMQTRKKKSGAKNNEIDEEIRVAREQLKTVKDAMVSDSVSRQSPERPGPILAGAPEIKSFRPADLEFLALPVDQPPVPQLAHGLDRVLFNPGVYRLQDPASRVYNFDPYLEKIMPVADFDFNALKVYKTSSEDVMLSALARDNERKYVGSTSSMTGMLGHFHYLISNWRELDFDMLSRGFPVGKGKNSHNFTDIYKSPAAIFLRWKDGTYAIDADKQYDGANVLMLLGRSLEKLLTMSTLEFERYRKGDLKGVSEEERTSPESYHYSTQGDFLMRSQLDAYDPRLPGTGMFDLKTRAAVSIRMQAEEYQKMTGYQIRSQHGDYESYEREYHDMIRSTLLKYSLQARMGRMDGIFIAYHNVEEIFGFQYMNLHEIDKAIHGQADTCLGDQEFRSSLDLVNKIFNKATEKFPEQSLRFHFETRPSPKGSFMYIFAEPMEEDAIKRIQNSQKSKIAEYERSVMGLDTEEAASLKDRASEAAKTAVDRLVPISNDGDQPLDPFASSRIPEDQTSSSPNAEAATASTTTAHFPDDTSLEANLRPLLALTLTLRSKVNNEAVDRPTKLSETDDWELEYSLQEMSNPSTAWAYYEATKARRYKAVEKVGWEDGSEDEETKKERKEREERDGVGGRKERDQGWMWYIDMLRQLSDKGREWKKGLEAMEEGREKVVVGNPVKEREE